MVRPAARPLFEAQVQDSYVKCMLLRAGGKPTVLASHGLTPGARSTCTSFVWQVAIAAVDVGVCGSGNILRFEDQGGL